jgi:hypothetical protein
MTHFSSGGESDAQSQAGKCEAGRDWSK